jgi:uncharacterized protein related to proFAR isomerase
MDQITYTQALEWIKQIRELLESKGTLKQSYIAPLNAITNTIDNCAKVENMKSIQEIKTKTSK